MDYIELDFSITKAELGQDLYPDRREHDIVAAVYHDQSIEKSNPDICALPPRLPDSKTHDLCIRGFPGYARDAVDKMRLSDRYLALDQFKDYVRVYLPYYIDYSRRFLSCLQSAYHNRAFAIGRDHFKMKTDVDTFTRNEIGENQVLSVSPPIASSVQSMALVGLAGTGKSTCNELITSIYPHVILHEFASGHRYLQIPILQLSAVDVSDEKAMFIRLAGQIDRFVGQGNVYKSLMIKQGNISKMLNFFSELAEQFHIGMIVIDEVQMIVQRKKLFEHILSLSNVCHVSICLIGTEESMPHLGSTTWFTRRFGELGLIDADSEDPNLVIADFGIQGAAVMTSVLKQIWRYQWTYTYTQTDEPDAESVELLVGASMGNIDLLTTLFVKAQRVAIKKGKKYCLSPEIVKEAIMPLKKAKRLLESERSNFNSYLEKEKKSLKRSLGCDIAEERAKEAQETQKESENRFLIKTKTLEDVTFRIMTMADYSPAKIERAFNRLIDNGQDLYKMDAKQRAKLVFAALQKEELNAEKNRKKKEGGPAGQAPKGRKKRSYPVPEEHLKEALAGDINDITNIQTTAS